MFQNSTKNVPHFIGIGAQRCGTTWLHRTLAKHPDLWLTPVKEIHFFDGSTSERYMKQLSKRARKFPKVGLWDLRYFARYPSNHWYKSLFRSAAAKGLLTGEITPRYATLSRPVFERIQTINPDVKLIYLMRHPVERMWSNYVNSVRKTIQTDEERSGALVDTDAALKAVIGRTPQRHSEYFRNISELEKVFAPTQFFYGFMEDMISRPAWLARQIADFLGVDPAFYTEEILPSPVGIVGRKHPIPIEFSKVVAETMQEDTTKLAGRFGGHAESWLEDIRQLTGNKTT